MRPEILFPAYLAGFNLIESVLPGASYGELADGRHRRSVVCAVPEGQSSTRAAIEEPTDPETELPGHFSRWRIEAAREALKGASPEAVELIIRAQSRLDAGGQSRSEDSVRSRQPRLRPGGPVRSFSLRSYTTSR